MNYLKVSPYQPTYKETSTILDTLQSGGVIVFPTVLSSEASFLFVLVFFVFRVVLPNHVAIGTQQTKQNKTANLALFFRASKKKEDEVSYKQSNLLFIQHGATTSTTATTTRTDVSPLCVLE